MRVGGGVLRYEGGDLLLTGVAWPTVGSLPRLWAVAWVVGWLPIATRHIRGGLSTRCAIQIDVLPYLTLRLGRGSEPFPQLGGM